MHGDDYALSLSLIMLFFSACIKFHSQDVSSLSGLLDLVTALLESISDINVMLNDICPRRNIQKELEIH